MVTSLLLPLKHIANEYRLGIRHKPWRMYYLPLAAIWVLALLLRVLHVEHLFYSPFLDMDEGYLAMAESLFSTSVPAKEMLWPPGYPFFVRLVSTIAPLKTITPPLLVQAVIDSFSVLFLAAIGRRVFAPAAGLLAAFGYAIYHIQILNCGLLMSESLSATLLIATTWAALRFFRKPGMREAVILAVFLALITHLRTNLLMFWLAVMLYGIVRALYCRKNSRVDARRLRALLLMSAIYFPLLIPWSVRNSIIAGRPIFLSNNSGLNLLLTNNPLSDGSWTSPNKLPVPMKRHWTEVKSEYETDARMREAATEYIKHHPWHVLTYYIPERLRMLFSVGHTNYNAQTYWPWLGYELGGNYRTHPFGPFFRAPLLHLHFLWPVGLIGFLVRGRREFTFVILLWFCLNAPLLIFPPFSRYRSVSDYLLILAAAALLAKVLSSYRRPVTAWLASAWVAATLLLTASGFLLYAGPNLLNNAATLQARGPQFNAFVGAGETLTITTATVTQPYRELVSRIKVDPERYAALHFSFGYLIEPLGETTRASTPNFSISFLDKDGRPVTQPPVPSAMLETHVPLNRYQEARQTAWRIVRVPPLAASLQIELTVNFACRLTLGQLSVQGPVWL